MNSVAGAANRIVQPAAGNVLVPPYNGRALPVMVTRVPTQQLVSPYAAAQPWSVPVAVTDGGTIAAPTPSPIECRVEYPQGVNPANANVFWQVLYNVKGATYVSPLRQMLPGIAHPGNRRVVIADKVQVILYGVSNTQGGTPANDVNVYVSMAPVFGEGQPFAPQWAKPLDNTAAANVVDNALGLKYTGGGILLSYQVEIETAATGNEPLWGMFFDLADVANLVSGATKPIPGSPSTPMTVVQSDSSFSDPMPGSMPFSLGLVFALSKTKGFFTTPDGAPQANVQTQVG